MGVRLPPLGGGGGTTTTESVGGGGVALLPVRILTVLCKKSVFWPGGWWHAAAGLEVEDIEWQRTTSGAEPADQSEEALDVEEEEEASTPAELERYGGGDSLSNTVRLGGGRTHFW